MAVLLVAGGCRTTPERGALPDRPSSVNVQVENRNRRDLAVFAVRSGTRLRLGTTTAGATGRFVVRNVDQAALNDFRLRVETIGSDQQFTTERVLVNPGQTVYLEVADLIATSRHSVR